MLNKIIVIGAGQGGLRAAALLAKSGYDVCVYESTDEDSVGINWFDGVSEKLFRDLDITIPENSFKGFPVSFTAPGSDKPLYIWTKPEGMDWSVNRRSFSKQLIAEARECGAELIFGTKVQSLIFNNSSVSGVTVNGEQINADLVIDSSGLHSPFRRSLPVRAGITAEPDESEVFNVYRGIYSQVPDFPKLPDNKKFRMYLKYQGKKSISWCGVEPSGELNVLVGMIGKMDLNSFNLLYSHLKMDNPIIDSVIDGRCAESSIPVRYPLTRFSFPGYAAVGDAAFMTIPIMGNGIENSIRAGQMLAEAIISDDSVSIETLWKYQVRYYREIGAACYLLDWVKRGLLESDNEELKKFIESGFVRDEDIKAVMSGHIGEIPLSEWIKKPGRLLASRKFTGKVLRYALKGVRAAAAAYSIPKKYNSIEIDKWAYKTENAMKII